MNTTIATPVAPSLQRSASAPALGQTAKNPESQPGLAHSQSTPVMRPSSIPIHPLDINTPAISADILNKMISADDNTQEKKPNFLARLSGQSKYPFTIFGNERKGSEIVLNSHKSVIAKRIGMSLLRSFLFSLIFLPLFFIIAPILTIPTLISDYKEVKETEKHMRYAIPQPPVYPFPHKVR